MLRVCSHEDDVPDESPDDLLCLEAIDMRHADVEEHHLRSRFAHDLGHPAGVSAFADHLEVRRLVQELPQSLPGEGLVIDDDHPVASHQTLAVTVRSLAAGASLRGSTMRTRMPPSARGFRVNDARSP